MVKVGITPEKAREIRAKKGLKETKLQKIRVNKGLSQSGLAKLSGVPQRAIRGYEQGEISIDGARLNTLCKLCSALDCKIGDIIESKKLAEKYKAVK
jgi:DNA-binding Xre family transcriptional regulator